MIWWLWFELYKRICLWIFINHEWTVMSDMGQRSLLIGLNCQWLHIASASITVTSRGSSLMIDLSTILVLYVEKHTQPQGWDSLTHDDDLIWKHFLHYYVLCKESSPVTRVRFQKRSARDWLRSTPVILIGRSHSTNADHDRLIRSRKYKTKQFIANWIMT